LQGVDATDANAGSTAPVFQDTKTKNHSNRFDGDLLAIKVKPGTEKYPFDQVQMKFIDDDAGVYLVSV
jgi:hypothetical protein